MDLTNEDVADILALLDSLPYDELDLRTPRFRLTLRRAADGGWTQESRVLSEPVSMPQSPNGPPPDNESPPDNGSPNNGVPDISEMSGTEGGAGGAGGGADADPALAAVTAPLPGTFYRAPRPGAPPFVEVGDLVREDTVVAIVETMKLMNSVPAGTRGRVARICLDSAEFAARGATLMFIEPDISDISGDTSEGAHDRGSFGADIATNDPRSGPTGARGEPAGPTSRRRSAWQPDKGDISSPGAMQSRPSDAGAPLGVLSGANSALNDTPNEDEPLAAEDMSDISGGGFWPGGGSGPGGGFGPGPGESPVEPEPS